MPIQTEIWTGEVQRKFRADGSWTKAIPDYSSKANNAVIHLFDMGADPQVLVNNTAYPIPSNELPNGDIAIVLDKYDTGNERITDDVLYALDVDLMSEVIDKHVETMKEFIFTKGIHSIAPQSNTANTFVIPTTGVSDGGANARKEITIKDLTNLKKAFDKVKVPQTGRVLVLCPEHFQQILAIDQRFENQYNDLREGMVLKAYGFDVYQYPQNPVYNTGLTKVSYGALPAPTTDCYASVAFHAPSMFKAMTEFEPFLLPKNLQPTLRENTFGLRARAIIMPKKLRAIGAIVSVP